MNTTLSDLRKKMYDKPGSHARTQTLELWKLECRPVNASSPPQKMNNSEQWVFQKCI